MSTNAPRPSLLPTNTTNTSSPSSSPTVEAGLGVTGLTDLLDGLLGGAVSALEKTLGVTDLEKSIGLSGCKTDGLTDIELIGKSLCNLEKGLGVTATSDFLDETLGGAVGDLEKKLGVTSLEEAIKATDC